MKTEGEKVRIQNILTPAPQVWLQVLQDPQEAQEEGIASSKRRIC